MTRPRLIHDCPYCGRTKFADETKFCCTEAEVQWAMKRYERGERRERLGDPEKYDRFTGSYRTLGEEFGQ